MKLRRTRMSRFDILVKYIPMIQADSIGKWVVDKENDGTPEHPIQMPFVDYSEMVHNFIDDVYAFEESNKDVICAVKYSQSCFANCCIFMWQLAVLLFYNTHVMEIF
jgi:hypothetical protein